MLAVAVLFSTVTVAAPASNVESFNEYIEHNYTASELRCSTLSDMEESWCLTAAYKARDKTIEARVRRSHNPIVVRYHAAWLAYRRSKCNDRPHEGSGWGSIFAGCMLDMAIDHEIELMNIPSDY